MKNDDFPKFMTQCLGRRISAEAYTWKDDSIIRDHEQVDYSEMSLPIWTIFNTHTIEYPKRLVARLFDMETPTKYVIVGDSIEKVRNMIPEWMVCFEKDSTDRPEIVESWL